MTLLRSSGLAIAAALSMCSMTQGAEPSDPLGAALRGMADPRRRQTEGAFGGSSRYPAKGRGKPAGSKLARKASRGRL